MEPGDGGVINFDKDNASAVKFTHNNYVALNDGVMNISGNNAVAMEGDKTHSWLTTALSISVPKAPPIPD